MAFFGDFKKALLVTAGFLLLVPAGALQAQEESKETELYRLDYERFTKIKALSEPRARCDGFYEFLKDRPNSKLVKNAQAEYLVILEGFHRAKQLDALEQLSDRLIRLFPKVGETYYFYGAALNEAKKYPEAMDALAKCYLLKNPASQRARSFLEYVYKSQNKGSLAGLDAVIQKARAELSKG